MWRLHYSFECFYFLSQVHVIPLRGVCARVWEGDYDVMTSAGVRAEPEKLFRHSNPHKQPFPNTRPLTHFHKTKLNTHTRVHTHVISSKWVLKVDECVKRECIYISDMCPNKVSWVLQYIECGKSAPSGPSNFPRPTARTTCEKQLTN